MVSFWFDYILGLQKLDRIGSKWLRWSAAATRRNTSGPVVRSRRQYRSSFSKNIPLNPCLCLVQARQPRFALVTTEL
jgi:hypothetical protein